MLCEEIFTLPILSKSVEYKLYSSLLSLMLFKTEREREGAEGKGREGEGREDKGNPFL